AVLVADGDVGDVAAFGQLVAEVVTPFAVGVGLHREDRRNVRIDEHEAGGVGVAQAVQPAAVHVGGQPVVGFAGAVRLAQRAAIDDGSRGGVERGRAGAKFGVVVDAVAVGVGLERVQSELPL